ncbi:hypothetical protein BJX63DRAFT_433515 [Aspergillus granulosus]|uniref:Hydrophobin n=1 Tax=Aspergillus granulosus TaxID=176169 RepID=A0ABR4H711_9EURO
MHFTLATFATLVAAVAAMPSQNKVNKRNIDGLQEQCGDLIVNCCVVNVNDDHSDGGITLINLPQLDQSENTYCSPTYENQFIGALALVLGYKEDDRFCDVPNVTYACCNGSECSEIPPQYNGGSEGGKAESY